MAGIDENGAGGRVAALRLMPPCDDNCFLEKEEDALFVVIRKGASQRILN